MKQLKACDCMQAGQPPSPVTLQVGEGTPIDLTPVLQNLGTSLRSAVQSAFSSATTTPTPAAASTAAAAPASAGGPAATNPAASSASPATAQTATEAAQRRIAAPGSQTNTPSGSTPSTAQAAPLNSFYMQQVVRSLLMAVTPFIGTQAGAGLPPPRPEPSTGAAHSSPAASGGASGGASGPGPGPAGIRNMTPADLERLLTDSLNHERRSQQAAAAADSNPASSGRPAQPSNALASSRGPEQPSNAPASSSRPAQPSNALATSRGPEQPSSASAPPASASLSGQVPSSSAPETSHAAVTQASLPTQQGAEAASGSGSTPVASPSDPADSSAAEASATEPSAREASRDATSQGDSKGKRPALPSRAAGLGSGGLPPREKLDKTSRKGSAKSSTDKGRFLRAFQHTLKVGSLMTAVQHDEQAVRIALGKCNSHIAWSGFLSCAG